MSNSGLPGKRVAAMRAGINTNMDGSVMGKVVSFAAKLMRKWQVFSRGRAFIRVAIGEANRYLNAAVRFAVQRLILAATHGRLKRL